LREAVHLRGAPARTHCCCMRCAHGGDGAPPTTRGARTPKVKIFQESSNLVINTAEGKGDMLINGRSLKGLFATVADLEDDVNAMTTVSAPHTPERARTCAACLSAPTARGTLNHKNLSLPPKSLGQCLPRHVRARPAPVTVGEHARPLAHCSALGPRPSLFHVDDHHPDDDHHHGDNHDRDHHHRDHHHQHGATTAPGPAAHVWLLASRARSMHAGRVVHEGVRMHVRVRAVASIHLVQVEDDNAGPGVLERHGGGRPAACTRGVGLAQS